MANTSEEGNHDDDPRRPPPLALKSKFRLAYASLLLNAPRRSDGTVKRWLGSFLDPKLPALPTHKNGVSTHDLVVDPSRHLWLRFFLPATLSSSASRPVIVFFHGGGFAFCSPGSRVYVETCRRTARDLNTIVVCVNYRLAPEHRCPSQYEDGIDVLRYLDSSDDLTLTNLLRSGDLSKCFIAGDSAGGNIAHHVARMWADDQGAGARRIRIRGLIAVQPFFGGKERVESEVRKMWAPLVTVEMTDWLWRAFLPEGEDRDHWAANVFGPRAEEAGELGERFPAVMVVMGGCDRLQDWQRRYVEGLRARGKEVEVVEYPKAFHSFYMFPEVKECGLFMQELKTFVHKCCAGGQ